MISRSIGTLGFALSACAALIVSAPQARAVPVEIDFSINFIPPSPVVPSPPPIFELTGNAAIFIGNATVPSATFNIGTLVGTPSPPPIFTGNFIPGDPCVGGGTCSVGFSFLGSANDGTNTHHTYSFTTGNVPSSDPLAVQSGNLFTDLAHGEIFVGIFSPGDPCFGGGVCHRSGPLVAFSTGTDVGTWDVTIQAQTPLPGALPLFASGLGALGLLGWRRKRRALG